MDAVVLLFGGHSSASFADMCNRSHDVCAWARLSAFLLVFCCTLTKLVSVSWKISVLVDLKLRMFEI